MAIPVDGVTNAVVTPGPAKFIAVTAPPTLTVDVLFAFDVDIPNFAVSFNCANPTVPSPGTPIPNARPRTIIKQSSARLGAVAKVISLLFI